MPSVVSCRRVTSSPSASTLNRDFKVVHEVIHALCCAVAQHPARHQLCNGIDSREAIRLRSSPSRTPVGLRHDVEQTFGVLHEASTKEGSRERLKKLRAALSAKLTAAPPQPH